MTLRDELMGIVRPLIRPNMGSDLAVFERLLAAVKRKVSCTQTATIERLRRDLDVPPPDVQEKVIKMLDLVSRDAFKKTDKEVRGAMALFVKQNLIERKAAANRIIICVWCGHTIERTGDIKIDVRAAQAHDASCDKNPVRRRAQAETVARCLEHLEKARKVFSLLPDLNCHEIKLIDALTVGIRALDRDHSWRA